MNIHVPQTEQSKAEIKELMMIENNIISSQSNKPIIGVIQDALLGTFKITSRDTFITKEHFMNIMMKLKQPNYKLPKPTIYKPKHMWTGKQVFDLILPNINLHRFTPQYTTEQTPGFSDNDSEVLIENGKLIMGQLCKRSIGATEGGIIHMTWLDHGPTEANNFISQTQYLVNYWLQNTGFSVGAGDIFANDTSNNAVSEIICHAKEKVNQIITIGKRNNIDPLSYESKINQVLNNAVSQSGREVEKNTTLHNNIKTTVTSGSKGSILNLAQIMGCVGQQNVAGQRVDLGYTNRVLPHFEKNDKSPAAKGFVENSYKKGLEPYEFFYHAMGGREGVIDTACKTSETGYIQRRLVKAMEDLQVFSDKTLRNSIGDVVQFVYGLDGMDATYLISENICLWKDDEEFKYRFYERFTPKQELEELRKVQIALQDKKLDFKSPVHIQRLLHTIKNKNAKKCDNLSPTFIYQSLEECLGKLSIYNKPNEIFVKLNNDATFLLKSMLRVVLSTKQVRKVHNLSKEAFVELLQCILYQFNRSIIQTGEMVGTTSAQSLGECTTQMTLNTFHNCGNSAKNVTLGVPRLKEIINVSKNIKSPSMILPLKSEYNTKEQANKIASELEYTKLHCLVKSFSVIPNQKSDYSEMYFDIPDTTDREEMCTSMIQYIMDMTILRQKQLTLLDISIQLLDQYQDQIYVCHNNENCDEAKIDIYMINTKELKEINIEKYIRVFAHKVQHECIIQGYSDIKKTYVNTDSDQICIETDGSNIDLLMNNKYFDYPNIRTNDIIDVYETLGIEAARNLLLEELKKVIEFDGTYVNIRHFLTLVDTMTYKGDIMAITRHGINKTNTGPLMKCSFEETVDVLTDAAVFAEADHLNGVTENIIVGKMSNIGTGNIDLFMDF
jgi:DNA-directed RNA polymerase II subunit RPB1